MLFSMFVGVAVAAPASTPAIRYPDPTAVAAPPAGPGQPAATAIDTALSTELTRAMASLRLPDAAPPYYITYDVLDGTVATAFGEFGALVQDEATPYRTLRTEVRVGDYNTDSSNFSSFGDPDGVVSRGLPPEDDITALRREIWLSTDDAYKQAIEQYSRKQAARKGKAPALAPDFTKTMPVTTTWDGKLPPQADAATVRSLASTLSAALDRWPQIEVGQCVARDWQGLRFTLSSEGARLWRPSGYAVVRVEGTIRTSDGAEVKDARWWVGRDLAHLPTAKEMLADVGEMADWLSGLAKAPKEDDYLGPVIFEGSAATELFSQLLAAELVGTPAAEEDDSGISFGRAPTARLGRRLLPAGWSVTDDPTANPNAAGAYAQDHEGVAPRKVDLVVDGVLRDVLMSRVPSKDRAGSNGHGRSLGNDRRAAMPAVVTVKAKRLDARAKLDKTALRLAAQTGHDYVLVIARIEPPAMTEDFSVTFTGEGPPPGLTPPYEAYRLYADGRHEPVRSLTFNGVDRRVLRDIAMASVGAGPTDMLDGPPGPPRFQIGPTGGIPVTWDAPSVLITEMELTSKGGGEPRALVLPKRTE